MSKSKSKKSGKKKEKSKKSNSKTKKAKSATKKKSTKNTGKEKTKSDSVVIKPTDEVVDIMKKFNSNMDVMKTVINKKSEVKTTLDGKKITEDNTSELEVVDKIPEQKLCNAGIKKSFTFTIPKPLTEREKSLSKKGKYIQQKDRYVKIEAWCDMPCHVDSYQESLYNICSTIDEVIRNEVIKVKNKAK